jgi:antitoxin (DNA-binding transcriptional repressor) of toxin-antitoxin stability system
MGIKMTATIGFAEAQEKLPELLQRVEAGEIIAVTRDGKQIALLSPIVQGTTTTQEAISQLRATRHEASLSGIGVKELINEGRK